MTRKRRRALVLRVVVFGAAATLLIWYAPFAWMLFNLHVERPHDDYEPLTSYCLTVREGDATQNWIEALAGVPRAASFDEMPPAGMQWSRGRFGGDPGPVDPRAALLGAWDPERRAILRVLARHFESEELTSALRWICELRDRTCVWDVLSLNRTTPAVQANDILNLCTTLPARARLRWEQSRDILGAWEDLKTVLMIVRRAPRNLLMCTLYANACESSALDELGFLFNGTVVERDIARDVDELLRSLPAPAALWPSAMRGEEVYAKGLVASCFSRDGSGNGYLVLSEQPETDAYGIIYAEQRMRLWNLLAPVYSHRRGLELRLERFYDGAARAAESPYAEAAMRLEAAFSRIPYRPSDGPFFLRNSDWSRLRRSYELVARNFAHRQAVRIMAALCLYENEQGGLPERLDELAPRYIEIVPLDPYCDGPFGYRRDGARYQLFSRGMNGVDDDGCPSVNAAGEPMPLGEDGDDVYTLPRGRADENEPILIPVDSAETAEFGGGG